MNAWPAGAAGASTGQRAKWLSGVVFAVALAVAACSTTTTATDTSCSLNSDCAKGLVCALAKCRPQCVKAADCPVTGSSCIDDGRNAVCETPTENNTPCNSEFDCPVPLACASDYRCRNLCQSAADCNVLGITGRVCARDTNGAYYCAEPDEVTNGAITVAAPSGAPVSTPVIEPEGGASAIVAALPPGVLIATNIGANGGVVGIDGIAISIPAGALTSEVPITIQLSAAPGPAGTVGEVFEIGPTGTQFAVPITIAFDYTDTQLGTFPPSDFAVETSAAPDSGASWTPLSQIVVDIYAHTIAGQTTHLSPYALVQQQGAGTAEGDASGGGSGSMIGTAESGSAESGSPSASGSEVASTGSTGAGSGVGSGSASGSSSGASGATSGADAAAASQDASGPDADLDAPTAVCPGQPTPLSGGLPFVVDSTFIPTGYYADGYYGDQAGLTMNGDTTGTVCGGRALSGAQGSCYAVTYTVTTPVPGTEDPYGYTGIYWQSNIQLGANDDYYNWGTVPGVVPPSGATQASFYAKGALGGEVVSFRVGDSGDLPCQDSVTQSLTVTLTPDWTLYTIPFDGQTYETGQVGGFGWSISASCCGSQEVAVGASTTFFVDNILWQ